VAAYGDIGLYRGYSLTDFTINKLGELNADSRIIRNVNKKIKLMAF
jgi:hypothetical protein